MKIKTKKCVKVRLFELVLIINNYIVSDFCITGGHLLLHWFGGMYV